MHSYIIFSIHVLAAVTECTWSYIGDTHCGWHYGAHTCTIYNLPTT